MVKLKFIGTGTGRCGTVFLARYLTSVNILCGHECFFNRDGIDQASARLNDPALIRASIVSGNAWLTPGDNIVAESSYMAAPFLNTPMLEGASVIHLIRNPLKVISSFVNAFNYFNDPTKMSTYERFISDQIPVLYKDMHRFERACAFYLEWNRMIEERSVGKRYMIHRVEDNPRKLWEFVGSPEHDPQSEFRDTRANTFPKEMIRLKQIPSGDVKDRFVEFASRHGYSLDYGLFG